MRILLNRPVSIQGVDYPMDADVSEVCSGTIQSLLAVGWARKEEGAEPQVIDLSDMAGIPAEYEIIQEQKADEQQAAIASDPVEVVQEPASIDTLDLPTKVKVSLKRQGLDTVQKLIEYHDKHKSFEPLREIGRNISRQIEKQIGR
jgi:hypothetical protein